MGDAVLISPAELDGLFDALRAEGCTVVGPTVRDGAVVLDEIDGVASLPRGWRDEQAPGRYRLVPDGDTLFGYAVGPHSLRRFLTPPELAVWQARRTDDGVVFEDARPEPPRYAFIGVRACDLAALEARAGVPEPWAQAALARSVLIAVQCTSAADTCFCASMGTGPAVRGGHDLAITELPDHGAAHELLVEASTDVGRRVLDAVRGRPAEARDRERAVEAVQTAADAQRRHLDPLAAREVLATTLDHPHWDEVAGRCLSCTNCTMVCPTCFCTSSGQDVPLGSDASVQVERWDSCFTTDFTHLHGSGSVRSDTRAQYRQWLTHKLGTWWDQLGTSGCVGCGRCITWCPVGIDLTAEVAALAEDPR